MKVDRGRGLGRVSDYREDGRKWKVERGLSDNVVHLV